MQGYLVAKMALSIWSVCVVSNQVLTLVIKPLSKGNKQGRRALKISSEMQLVSLNIKSTKSKFHKVAFFHLLKHLDRTWNWVLKAFKSRYKSLSIILFRKEGLCRFFFASLRDFSKGELGLAKREAKGQ